MGLGATNHYVVSTIAQTGGVSRTPADVFDQVFTVFVVLGTLVGLVVVAYTLSKALRYIDDGERGDDDPDGKVVRPTLGELPTGSGGGRKLFVSFGISAVIVLSLIVWTYSALLYVDDTPPEVEEEAMEVDVTGLQFAWQYTYPNGHTDSTLRVPVGQPIRLNVTSADVWHNYAISEFKVKTDAIPGQTTEAWFTAEETGTYEAVCYELCGAGHSAMRGDVIVMEPDEYQDWYESTNGTESNAAIASAGAGA
jgi:cytochrome c oxidase subunit 2